MNIEDKVINLLEEEFGVDGINRGFNSKSDYKYNGRSVPRVTTIISEMQSDSSLIKWSNYLGFNHINYQETISTAATIGTQTHAYIEEYIQGAIVKPPERDEVVNCVEAFKEWWITLNSTYIVTVVGEEQSLTCPWYGGTYDLLLDLNGKKILVDFKTSNHITFRYFIQLAAYIYLINTNLNINIDGCILLRMDKETANYEMTSVDMDLPEDKEFMDHCKYTFFSLVNSYYALSRIKKEYSNLIKVNTPIPQDPLEEKSDLV